MMGGLLKWLQREEFLNLCSTTIFAGMVAASREDSPTQHLFAWAGVFLATPAVGLLYGLLLRMRGRQINIPRLMMACSIPIWAVNKIMLTH